MQSKSEAKTVAIIGAGISGLTAARMLTDAGIKVTVFEKSRGVGGRTANRRSEHGSFDHGAQYFTVKDREFRSLIDRLISKGAVASWTNPADPSSPDIVHLSNGVISQRSLSNEKYVGTPAMNSICKHLSHEIEVVFNSRVVEVLECPGKVQLRLQGEEKATGFDGVIISTPSFQASELTKEWPKLSAALEAIEMRPCWACLATFEHPVTSDWVGAFLKDSHIAWIARNNTKPGRNSKTENIVIHATAEWSQAHLKTSQHAVAEMLLEEFWLKTGLSRQPAGYLNAHLWRYAVAAEELHLECLSSSSSNLVICGDWAHGSRVEGAFLSGRSASTKMLAKL